MSSATHSVLANTGACMLRRWADVLPLSQGSVVLPGASRAAWDVSLDSRCLSSFSHVVGDAIHSGVPSDCVRHGRLRLSQGSDAGALGSGFRGVWHVHLVLVPFLSSLLLRAQICGMFLVIPGRAHAGVSWSRKGLVPHPLYPSPPDSIVPRLGVCTDKYFWNLYPFLPLTRATRGPHLSSPWSRIGDGNMKFEFGGSLFSENEAFMGQVEELILLKELAVVLGLGSVETRHNSFQNPVLGFGMDEVTLCTSLPGCCNKHKAADSAV